MIFNIFTRNDSKSNFGVRLQILVCVGIIVFFGAIYAIAFAPLNTVLLLEYRIHSDTPEVAHQYLNQITTTTLTSPHMSREKIVSFIQLLQSHIMRYPKDKFNSKYLTYIAYLYHKIHAILQANYYFSLSMTPSLFNTYPTTSFEVLSFLSELEYNNNKKIEYNTLLLSLYPDEIHKGKIYYELGKLYDEKTEWDNAYYYYNLLLMSENYVEIDDTDSHKEELFFRNRRHVSSAKKTWRTLDSAKAEVQRSLYLKNSHYIKSLQAPGFFTVQWQESRIDSNAQIKKFDIIPIIQRSNVSVSNTFSRYISKNEVLWPTFGWERTNVWNLVFRRIQQPDTVAINGRWEWAGIYFGIGNQLYEPE